MKLLYSLFIITFLFPSLSNQNKNRTKNFPKEELQVKHFPKKENVWVFLMAGQSNMAGRGFVEPKDTIPNTRVITINVKDDVIYAKEPLHFYEPTMAGLDIGKSFGEELIKHIPDSITVLLIPTAVGGSKIEKWINDENFRKVRLFSNFEEKLKLAENYGEVKGILWHQGESNTSNKNSINAYENNLSLLISKFRKIAKNNQLPVIIGELGSYSENKDQWNAINSKIISVSKTDSLIGLVRTQDLTDRGDNVHFNSKSIRLLGKRYAKKFMEVSPN
ncbi:sialate O-acetylesterase [Formosa undariae]|uniref:Sialate O-acetylesterase n=1 Tax=Formosa undariae TaxID=1325436 RepID=A0ABV5F0H4_9FLAO